MLQERPKIYTLGFPETESILSSPVHISEKVDGSFFAFGIEGGNLKIRSRRQSIQLLTTKGNFGLGTQSVVAREEQLKELYHHVGGTIIFYGETLMKPKHNKIAYDSTPEGNIILFGARVCGNMVSPERFQLLVNILNQNDLPDLTCVQTVEIENPTPDNMREFIDNNPSQLGGMMEGLVIRSLDLKDVYSGDPLYAKIVSQAFRERIEAKTPKNEVNPLEKLLETLPEDAIQARWDKALQHLEEEGILTGTPADIGPFMIELCKDVDSEDTFWIDMLWKGFYRKRVIKHIQVGAAEWFKQQNEKSVK